MKEIHEKLERVAVEKTLRKRERVERDVKM